MTASKKVENIFDSLDNDNSSVLHQYDSSFEYSLIINSDYIGCKRSKELIDSLNQQGNNSESTDANRELAISEINMEEKEKKILRE